MHDNGEAAKIAITGQLTDEYHLREASSTIDEELNLNINLEKCQNINNTLVAFEIEQLTDNILSNENITKLPGVHVVHQLLASI